MAQFILIFAIISLFVSPIASADVEIFIEPEGQLPRSPDFDLDDLVLIEESGELIVFARAPAGVLPNDGLLEIYEISADRLLVREVEQSHAVMHGDKTFGEEYRFPMLPVGRYMFVRTRFATDIDASVVEDGTIFEIKEVAETTRTFVSEIGSLDDPFYLTPLLRGEKLYVQFSADRCNFVPSPHRAVLRHFAKSEIIGFALLSTTDGQGIPDCHSHIEFDALPKGEYIIEIQVREKDNWKRVDTFPVASFAVYEVSVQSIYESPGVQIFNEGNQLRFLFHEQRVQEPCQALLISPEDQFVEIVPIYSGCGGLVAINPRLPVGRYAVWFMQGDAHLASIVFELAISSD